MAAGVPVVASRVGGLPEVVGESGILVGPGDGNEIAAALDWHLCRCGVHNRIMDAVALAARRMRERAAA